MLATVAEGDAPAPSIGTDELRSRGKWIGSASVPGAMGYMDIGMFLAVMEVGAGLLLLRVRPAIVRMMFGIEDLRAVPGPSTVICQAHKFGQTGIEVRREGMPSSYFWTGNRGALLASLAGAGFRVSTDEVAMSYRSANRALRSARRTK
jgi:hypothetical protein